MSCEALKLPRCVQSKRKALIHFRIVGHVIGDALSHRLKQGLGEEQIRASIREPGGATDLPHISARGVYLGGPVPDRDARSDLNNFGVNIPGVESIEWIEISDHYQIVSGVSSKGQRPKITGEELLFLARPVLSIENLNNRENSRLKEFSLQRPG